MQTFPRYDIYKDSGIDWLGPIPAHWESQRLKHIANVQLSNVDKHTRSTEIPVRLCNYTDVYYKDFITENIEFMQATATESQIAEFRLEKDDVLITKDSESPDDIAVPAYVPQSLESVICGYHLAHIRPLHIQGKYLFRSFQARPIASQFEMSANGITRYGISKSVIGNALFLLPPLEEQERIARFLDEKTQEIDRAIAQKRRLIDLLQEQKAILINTAVTHGLNPHAPTKDSGINWLGPIPAHWEVRRLKYLFQEVDKRTTTGQETLFSLRMYDGLVPYDDVGTRPITDDDVIGYKVIQPGQFVMNRMRATVGLFAVASYEGLVSPDYTVFNYSPEIDAEYYLYLFKTQLMGTVFRIESKGIGTGFSGFLRIYTNQFGAIHVPLPPKQEQNKIVQYIKKVEQDFAMVIDKVNTEMSLLATLKKVLISEAVTGKIKV